MTTSTINFYTDEKLREHLISGSAGDKNSAPHLLTVPEDMRPTIVGKAHRRMNMEPGWNYSGSVRQECKDYNANPDAYRELVQEHSERTREIQSWQRATGNIASLASHNCAPGETIYPLNY